MSRVWSRRGVTLVELLIGLVITSIIGAGLVKLLLGETRFMEQQEAWRTARAVSRSSVNMLLSDVRMVEATGGLDPVTAGGRDLTLRVPYAFGLVCGSNGTLTTVSLLPVDSSMFAAGASGFAWRNPTTGVYTYVAAAPTIASPGTTATCTGAGITTVPASGSSPAGRIVNLTAVVNPVPTTGSVLFLYRRIRYEFRASASVTGRDGLWRTVQGQAAQELAAPFDTGARAAFFVLNSTTAQIGLPAPLSDARGLELRLDGSSENTPRGNTAPKNANVTTAVFFSNRPD
jgi:prepilin-type N-terminal cleavage/methylation domain-containing protein